MKPVAALYVREDSVYKRMPGVDAWDKNRDARLYAGPAPVVAHPPCRLWGVLSSFSTADESERELAFHAVERARLFGGVVEHPAHSKLWSVMGLPQPGSGLDSYGGLTISINQFAFGHQALKPTWLYIVRCADIPTLPVEFGHPSHCIARKKGGKLPHVTKPKREHTPPAFAAWLVEVARRSAAIETLSSAPDLA